MGCCCSDKSKSKSADEQPLPLDVTSKESNSKPKTNNKLNSLNDENLRLVAQSSPSSTPIKLNKTTLKMMQFIQEMTEHPQNMTRQEISQFLLTEKKIPVEQINEAFQLVFEKNPALEAKCQKNELIEKDEDDSTDEDIDALLNLDTFGLEQNSNKEKNNDDDDLLIELEFQNFQLKQKLSSFNDVIVEEKKENSKKKSTHFETIKYDWDNTLTKKQYESYRKLTSHVRAAKSVGLSDNDIKLNDETLETKYQKQLQKRRQKYDKTKNITKNIDTNVLIKINETKLEEEKVTAKKDSLKSKQDEYLDKLYNDDKEISVNEEHQKSLRVIKNYKGNSKYKELMKLYKKQYEMKKKLDALKRNEIEKNPPPPKPTDWKPNEKTLKLLDYVKYTFSDQSVYTGIANFGPNGELGLELGTVLDPDDMGNFKMKRNIDQSTSIEGIGKIFADLYWNGTKYIECVRFEYTDVYLGVKTKLEFNSIEHELDVKHSFYNGKIIRYPNDMDPNDYDTMSIMHVGWFDFICASTRRKGIRRKSLAGAADLLVLSDGEEDSPKWLNRISEYGNSSKHQQNKSKLFGHAIKNVNKLTPHPETQ